MVKSFAAADLVASHPALATTIINPASGYGPQ
jgi:hypothetical protein